MKSRPCERLFTESQIKEQVEKTITEKYDEIAVDISAQLIAVILLMLDKEYGWRKQRLRKFIEHLQEEAELISVVDIIGKRADARKCVKYIKERYDIDLDKELSEI